MSRYARGDEDGFTFGTGNSGVLLFVVAMIGGMVLARWWRDGRAPSLRAAN